LRASRKDAARECQQLNILSAELPLRSRAYRISWMDGWARSETNACVFLPLITGARLFFQIIITNGAAEIY
jgi:hypothetical protein